MNYELNTKPSKPITIEKRAVRPRLPAFLKQRIPHGPAFTAVTESIQEFKLNTVCEEAKCPNRTHCYARGTLTFQILGKICTRACGFCAETFGKPSGLIDPDEPRKIVEAATRLKLNHVVITSPARDDLEDDGAGQFAATIQLFREKLPHVTVEILTPDMRGKPEPLQTLFEAGPDIFNHNIETVRRLTPRVRSRATYERTLGVLKAATVFKKNKERRSWFIGHGSWLPENMHLEPCTPLGLFRIKSGLMVGHGETREELIETFKDLAESGVQMLTIGQYLPPSPRHLPLVKTYLPEEFKALKTEALKFGFMDVSAGPLVRSSFHADETIKGVHSS